MSICLQQHLLYAESDITATTSRETISFIMYSAISTALTLCCNREMKLKSVRKASNQYELEKFHNPAVEDMLLPIARSHDSHLGKSSAFQHILFIESPGVAVMEATKCTSSLADTMYACWTLFVLMVLLCMTSGVLIWALDSYRNPDDFPKSFLKGFPEGVWWAFVSMTTVGYGDRTPKSLAGRLLGVIWIICGIVVVAVFTATVTTSLNTDTTYNTNIFGMNVGVLNMSEEQHLAVGLGAKVTVYGTIEALFDELEHGKLSIGLIDMFHLIPVSSVLADKHIKISSIWRERRSHGAKIRSFLSNDTECLRMQLDLLKYDSTYKISQRNHMHMNLSYSTADNVNRMVGVSDTVLITLSSVMLFAMVVFCVGELIIIPKLKARNKTSSAKMEAEMQKVPEAKSIAHATDSDVTDVRSIERL